MTFSGQPRHLPRSPDSTTRRGGSHYILTMPSSKTPSGRRLLTKDGGRAVWAMSSGDSTRRSSRRVGSTWSRVTTSCPTCMSSARSTSTRPASRRGLKMKVPANLLYEIVTRDGGLAIKRMQAHWELNRMSRILMSEGALGMRTIAVMNWRMLRAFGPKWLMSYFKSSQTRRRPRGQGAHRAACGINAGHAGERGVRA